jgi:hypothetical protein
MNSILGCGHVLYCNLQKEPDNSYISTEWLCVFYIPIFLLTSYRLIKNEETIMQSRYVI